MSLLRSRVRWSCFGHGREATPCPDLPSAEWAWILWNFYCYRSLWKLLQAVTQVTVCEAGWLGTVGEHPRVPVEPWDFEGLVRRGRWPLGLIYEMARDGCRRRLEEPGSGQPPWLGGLTALAASWYGADFGVRVHNSLVRSRDDRELAGRWRLAFTQPQVDLNPPYGTPVRDLDRLTDILDTAHPGNAPHWEYLLLARKSRQSEHQRVWRLPLPEETLALLTEEPEGVFEVPLGRLAQLGEVQREWQALRPLLPEQLVLGEVMSRQPGVNRRLLTLACLGQLRSGSPDPLLMRAASSFELEGGGAVLRVRELWNEIPPLTEVHRQAADTLQVPAQKLGQLSHWRHLCGEVEALPKMVRDWLGRNERRQKELNYLKGRCLPGASQRMARLAETPDPQQELRQLMRLQLSVDGSLQVCGERAWQRLLRQATAHLVEDCLGLERGKVDPEFLEPAWMLREPASDALLRRIFVAAEEVPRWLPPAALDRSYWDSGPLHWEGGDYQVERAEVRSAVLMGTHFGTCLTLRDGVYASSALINALDPNKKVLYLKDQRGHVVLRQLLAIDQGGWMVPYQVYRQCGMDGLVGPWWKLVQRFAQDCGVPLRAQEFKVLCLQGRRPNYYCDSPEAPPAQRTQSDEDHFWQNPSTPRPGCSRQELRRLLHLLQGGRGGQRQWTAAARLGETQWLEGRPPMTLNRDFLEHLDPAADPRPLLRHRIRPGSSEPIPVALVALPVCDLVTVLKSYSPDLCRPGPGRPLQAMILLYASWRRQPDPGSLWRHLGGPLATWLWWFLSLVKVPQVLARRPRGQPRPYTVTLAEGLHGLEMDSLRERFCQGYSNAIQAAALIRSPHSQDRKLARDHVAWVRSDSLMAGVFRGEVAGYFPTEELYSLSRNSFADLEGGLAGKNRLERWVESADSDWRRDLLARLLGSSLGNRRDYGNAEEWALDLLHADRRQWAWHFLESLGPDQRLAWMAQAWTQVLPQDWERMAQWTPGWGEWTSATWSLLEETAAGSRRFQEWMSRF